MALWRWLELCGESPAEPAVLSVVVGMGYCWARAVRWGCVYGLGCGLLGSVLLAPELLLKYPPQWTGTPSTCVYLFEQKA